MLSIAYRLYRSLPGACRVALLARVNSLVQSSRAASFLWRKTVLRYHCLYDYRRGVTIEPADKCNLKCFYRQRHAFPASRCLLGVNVILGPVSTAGMTGCRPMPADPSP